MNKDFFYKSITTIAALFFVLLIAAQDTTVVKATIDRSQIVIGEPIRLTLEADIPEHEPIRFFQVDSIPHFEFLKSENIDTSNTGRGTTLLQVIHLTSWDSGHWVIPAFTLRGNIVTDSLPVDVGFSPFNPDQPYHDVKEIIEVNPKEEEKKMKWWWIVVAGAALVIVMALLFRKKKKPVVQAVAPPPDPFREAIGKLEQLQKDKPEAKQYYSRLVDIFRGYLDAKKGIHSLQATSDDLIVKLKSLQLSKEQFEALAQSLRLGDFVKFAKYVPSPEEDQKSFTIIYTSIQQIEQAQ